VERRSQHVGKRSTAAAPTHLLELLGELAVVHAKAAEEELVLGAGVGSLCISIRGSQGVRAVEQMRAGWGRLRIGSGSPLLQLQQGLQSQLQWAHVAGSAGKGGAAPAGRGHISEKQVSHAYTQAATPPPCLERRLRFRVGHACLLHQRPEACVVLQWGGGAGEVGCYTAVGGKLLWAAVRGTPDCLVVVPPAA